MFQVLSSGQKPDLRVFRGFFAMASRLLRVLLPRRRFVRGRSLPDWRSLVLLVVYKGEDTGLRAVADALGPRELSRRLLLH